MRRMISKSTSCAMCMEMYVVVLSIFACREVALSEDKLDYAPAS